MPTTPAGAGQTLLIWDAGHFQPPAANYAYRSTVNATSPRLIGVFVSGTATALVLHGVMPQSYDNAGNGVTVVIHWASKATTGTNSWKAEFERVNGVDLTADHWDTADAQTATPTVPGTANTDTTTSLNFTVAQAAGIQAGDEFRLRITRPTGDSSGNDGYITAVELREHT